MVDIPSRTNRILKQKAQICDTIEHVERSTYEQFKTAMSRLETIAVEDWPGVGVSEPAFAENGTVRPV